MKRAIFAGGVFATVLVLVVLGVSRRAAEQDAGPAAPASPAITRSTAAATEETDEAAVTHQGARDRQGFLHARITTTTGGTYEGRLRWGGQEEASWGDYFNGAKKENPWVADVPVDRRPTERRPIEILGVKLGQWEREIDLGRLFMARFGDIARIESRGRDVRVTLKSGTVHDLDRFEASDFDDGLRVWDDTRGVVDLDSLQVRTIEFVPTPALGASAPYRLHGTVRTRQGDFTGFVQWNREEGVGTDTVDGTSAEGEFSLRFDAIRSIARDARDSSRVTLLDGREIVLSDTAELGDGNRGIYVDDPRYGRVLISWDTFERVDFDAAGSGPAYGDFPPGHPLTGSVTTRAGDRLTGRLVWDLDESETIETLDAPSQGVDYTILFGLIASIVCPPDLPLATVTLHSGEELQLERAGDLGEGNAGMLIFVDDGQHPEYVPWTDVAQVDFDRPPTMYPPFGGR